MFAGDQGHPSSSATLKMRDSSNEKDEEDEGKVLKFDYVDSLITLSTIE